MYWLWEVSMQMQSTTSVHTVIMCATWVCLWTFSCCISWHLDIHNLSNQSAPCSTRHFTVNKEPFLTAAISGVFPNLFCSGVFLSLTCRYFVSLFSLNVSLYVCLSLSFSLFSLLPVYLREREKRERERYVSIGKVPIPLSCIQKSTILRKALCMFRVCTIA
jgi:hypothetical protein